MKKMKIKIKKMNMKIKIAISAVSNADVISADEFEIK